MIIAAQIPDVGNGQNLSLQRPTARPSTITKMIAINYVFPVALLEYDVRCVLDVTRSPRIARINIKFKKNATDF